MQKWFRALAVQSVPLQKVTPKHWDVHVLLSCRQARLAPVFSTSTHMCYRNAS
jgi:hypothetical protein